MVTRPLLTLLALVALAGCTNKDNGADTSLDDVDIDGDGYSVLDDCDDEDASVNPGADELCDDLDNNCDGEIDNDPVDGVTYYRDGDGDGAGDDSRAVVSCEAVEDHVLSGGDCDDGRRDIYPGAPEEDCADPVDYNCDGSTGYSDGDGDGFAACEECDDSNEFINPDGVEICDDLDNDCDALIDDDDPTLTGAPTWYVDGDADGYGTSRYTDAACEQPEGYADNDDDCDDGDASLNPETIWYADSDGDGYGDAADTVTACTGPTGYVLNADDCDDADASVNPGAIWFIDSDGDGYGDSAAFTTGCEQPSGYAGNADDCDDGDAGISPASAEICDDADNNCDGRIDEDSATDATDWYLDSDSDGFGDSGVSTPACDQPRGYISDPSDCDDSDASVNPDAVEVCNDGVDNDCDGGFDPCTLDLGGADTILEGVSASGSAGVQVAAAGDVDGDGNDDLWVSAYLEDANGADSGSTYLFRGPMVAGTYSMSTYDARLVGEADDRSGQAMSGGYDVSGDGVPDVLVSAHRNNGDQVNRGGVTYLLFGGSGVNGDIDLTTDSDVYFYGEINWDRLGLASEMVGDVVDSASNDVALGAPFRNDNGLSDCGAVYVAAGPFSGPDYDIEDADLVLEGESDNDQIGTRLTAGDLDGDGVNELIIGAQLQDAAGASAGAVYVIEGDTSGRLWLADYASLGTVYKLTGESGSDSAGQSVAVGDLTGDGNQDLLIGAGGDDDGGSNSGAVYIVSSTYAFTSGSLSSNDAKVIGAASDETIGDSISGAGDVDGDGNADLLVGAASSGSNTEGQAHLVYGPLSGSVSLTDANVTLTGESVNDGAGGEVKLMLDLFGAGDGLFDVVVAAPNSDRNGTDSGAIYIVSEFGQ